LVFLILGFGNTNIGLFVDMDGLCGNGKDWKIISEQGSLNRGSIRLYQDEWFMYFLHWRPLTGERDKLNREYARELMLSFWGPDMPFTLTHKEGELEIAGHKAYLVEGTIYEGRVHTRFIVWNCPETKRQFIADCNINVGRGTSENLLDLQEKITKTISCHPGGKIQNCPRLEKKYTSEKYGLSFLTPENCRTHDYDPLEWFPEGMEELKGSLWTLPTDSAKYVELLWENKKEDISRGMFINHIKRRSDSHFKTETGTTWKILGLSINKIEQEEGHFTGAGAFTFYLKKGEREAKIPYCFKAMIWENDNKTYFLLGALAALDRFWGRPVNLAPSEITIDRFFKEDLLPNVEVFK
jgi:hypothetical protein